MFLAIDQYRKQLTVSVRNEARDVTLRQQVSTEWGRVRAFFDELRRNAEPEGGFAAVVELALASRIGSITKQGSAMARFDLGHMVLHVLRRDGQMAVA
jgi:hypothetical protein